MSAGTVATAGPAPARATRFRALGTYVYVATELAADLATATTVTQDVLAAVDRTCSRFRADSDLARANRGAGRWVAVDPVLVGAVEAALRAAHDTGGLVNPLLGKVIVDLGYDRDFAELRPAAGAARARHPRVVAHDPDAWREIDVAPGAVRLPAGTALDLGSVGKAWAADLVVGTWAARLDAGALVSVGGDIALLGDGEWPVAVQEEGEADHLVWVRRGGLATSSTQVRRWTHEGVVRHHLLDPRTGRPATETWRTVTATGPTCAAANAATTAAVVLGPAAPDWLAGRGVDARLVRLDGHVHTVGAWPREGEPR